MEKLETLDDAWVEFEAAVLQGKIPPEDLHYIRKIFYTGAASLWSVSGDIGRETDPEKQRERMRALHRELELFRIEVALEHALTKEVQDDDGDPS